MLKTLILYEKLKKQSQVKNPVWAGFLSLIYPGLGQIYVGEMVKGIIFCAIWAVLIVLCFLGIGWVFAFPFGAYAIVDAYNKAVQINHEEFLKLAEKYVKEIEKEEREKLLQTH
jgi:TM2 domain-containing membrane protein YozV